jgi:hypothetical protein
MGRLEGPVRVGPNRSFVALSNQLSLIRKKYPIGVFFFLIGCDLD